MLNRISIPRKISAQIPQRKRLPAGATLVEIMMVAVVTALVNTSVLGMLLIASSASRKLQNSTDSADGIRNAISRIGKDVRSARAIGDIYGTTLTLDTDSGGTTSVYQGSDIFPSASDNIYASGASPPAGWPTWADGSKPTSFQLGSNTLIVQVPIFDSNGFPVAVPGTNPPAANVETHIYRVLHRSSDPSSEYILQWANIPGAAVTGVYTPSAVKQGPFTIATGIIGPRPSGTTTGSPMVFQYVDRYDTTGTPVSTIPTAKVPWVADFDTVIINLEMQKHQYANSNYKGSLAIKEEVSFRNNALATSVGNFTSVTGP